MARVSKTIHVCDRDGLGKEREATATRRFTVEGTKYKLKLCEEHARLFDTQMFAWSRLAEEEGEAFSTYNSDYSERARRAADLRAKQQAPAKEVVIELPKPLLVHKAHQLGVPVWAEEVEHGERYSNGWKLTEHVRERMEQRGYSLQEVLTAAESPEIAYDDVRNGKLERCHHAGECTVVVNPREQVIITVLHRDEAKYALDHQPELTERVAR